jgi:aromatic ring-opening dioxygenase catalytic subunit (LigB family)
MSNQIDDGLPTLFIPHGGGPCFFMDWDPPDTWDRVAAWLKALPNSLGVTPKVLLVVSGHWEEEEFTLNSGAHPPLLYDYYGFPPHTYQLKYDAPGSPELAERVAGLLAAEGIPAHKDSRRGFDHGVFIPLKVAYPEAEIPILQLSLKQGLDPATHIAAGRALAPLRREGVLIVGSGMSYHNLRGFGPQFTAPSEEFDAWLTQAVCERDVAVRDDKLRRWKTAPHARTAHPQEEHLLPLMVAAGAARDNPGRKTFSHHVMGVSVSAFQFGGS